ncbi:hypothetical protein H0H92_009661 [Tricholoma furcatifolium]|nr:hypothetical protein H0H92_009661 [Tricholoma furcatifolium]
MVQLTPTAGNRIMPSITVAQLVAALSCLGLQLRGDDDTPFIITGSGLHPYLGQTIVPTNATTVADHDFVDVKDYSQNPDDAKMAVDDKPTGKVKVEEAEVKEDEQHLLPPGILPPSCSFDETCPIIDCRSCAVRDVIEIATLAALADAAADAAIEGRPPPALSRLPNPSSMALLANQDIWYMVNVGRRVGVYRGWANTEPLVIGVPKFACRKFATRAEAEEALLAAAKIEALTVVIMSSSS